MANLIRIDNQLINLDSVRIIHYKPDALLKRYSENGVIYERTEWDEFSDSWEFFSGSLLIFSFFGESDQRYYLDTATQIWQGLCRMAVLSNV